VPRLRRLSIDYPIEARAAGAEGRLVLDIEVDAKGGVGRVRVVTSVHPAIDRVAVQAVRSWRFDPARSCGKAVASTYMVARTFELVD